jgi:hypothetical protein
MMHPLEVALRFETSDPPSGEATAADERRPFVGWLDLLRVLSELVESAPPHRDPPASTSSSP